MTFAVLVGASSGALAGDAKTYSVHLRDRWKAGDVVTRTGATTERQAVTVTAANGKVVKDQTTDTQTTFVRVEKCVEADAQGHLVKALVHFLRWSQVAGAKKDESLTGVTLELSGRGGTRTWKAVSDVGKPSAVATAWIGAQPGLASDDDVGNELMENKTPVAVGQTWVPDRAAYFAELSKGMALDAEKSEITMKLEAVDGSEATVLMTLAVASKGLPDTSSGTLYPWLEGGTWTFGVRWIRNLDDGVGAGRSTGDVAVLGVIQTPSGAKLRYDKKIHSETTLKPGGEIPAGK